jgi:hypothetical protein
MMGIAQGMKQQLVLEIGRPVIVNKGAGEFRQNANGVGGFFAPTLMRFIVG